MGSGYPEVEFSDYSAFKMGEEELGRARKVAEEIWGNNRRLNIRQQTVCKGYDYEINERGIVAEWAFCVYMGIERKPICGEDRGYDCEWKGMRVGVKSTRYREGALIELYRHYRDPIDVYALVVDMSPWFRMAGWVWKGEFWEKGGEWNIYSDAKPSKFMSQSQLYPIEWLKYGGISERQASG